MSSKQLYCLQLTNSFDDRDNYSSVIIAWQEISLTMAVVRGNMSWLDSGSIGFEVYSRPVPRLLTLHPTKKITLETVHLWWSVGAVLDIMIQSGDEIYVIVIYNLYYLYYLIITSCTVFWWAVLKSLKFWSEWHQSMAIILVTSLANVGGGGICQEKWHKNIIH